MKESSFNIALRLIANGLRFQYLRRTGKPGRPQALSLEITHHCIAKCVMCNIWKIPHEVSDLPMDVWIDLLSSDLLSDLRELDITGGEPFLRRDLLDLFTGICDLKKNHLMGLKSIAVTTNGFLTPTIMEKTETILQMLTEKQIDLVIVCAMDAIGETHDKIRKHKDAWTKVNETIQVLKRLRENHSNLIIGLKTTILPINVGALEDIIKYADSNALFTIISPCIITKGRYLNQDRGPDLAFTPEDRSKMISFYKSDRFQWSFHGERLARYFETGEMKKPCSCGFNYLFVRSTGELHLCPLIDVGLGNIREKPIEDLFFSEKASRIRRKIGRYTECKRCTEPGLERYALSFEGLTYLSLFLRMGRKKFFQLHRHMGLDKYID